MGLWSMLKDTAYYGRAHLTHLPHAIQHMRDDPNSNRIIKRLFYIVQSDKLPVFLVGGTFYLLHQQMTAWQDEKNTQEDGLFWSSKALLQWGLISLQIGVHIFKKRQELKFRTHVIFLNADMGKVLAQTNPNFQLHTDICKSRECSFLRVSQGLVRDVVSYLLTDISITGSQFLGGPAALPFIFRAMNEGRFVLSMLVASCNREQSAYAAQNPGLVLAIGLGYTVPLQLAILAGQQIGLPKELVDSLFAEVFLVLELLLASTLKLPKPRGDIDDSLQWGDPVGFFQWGVGFLFDTLALGLKEKIDRSCRQSNNNSLGTLTRDPTALYTMHIAKQLLHVAYWVYGPAILRDKKLLMSDPIVGVYLNEVLLECIPIIKKVEQLAANQKIQGILQILIISPKRSSDFIRTFYNLPAPLIIALLHLVKQGHLHLRVVELREFLESFLPPNPIQIPLDSRYANAILVPKNGKDLEEIQEKFDELSRVGTKVNRDAQQRSRFVAETFFGNRQDVARSRSSSPPPQQIDKQRKRANDFFKPAPKPDADAPSAAPAQRAVAYQYFGNMGKM